LPDNFSKKTVYRIKQINNTIELLKNEYDEMNWEVRREPISELVYTILSQHTSDVNSIRAFDNLIEKFKSFEEVKNASIREIETVIYRGGLSNIKALRIKEVLRIIYEDIGSFDLSFLSEMNINEAKSWLKSLPGIGPKTAAIVLCFSFGMPVMPVDTHIFRLSRRLGFISNKTNADDAHEILENMILPEKIFSFHMNLIKHGREICLARRPKCGLCVLSTICPSKQ